MASKRDQIRMSEQEVKDFLLSSKTLILTSIGADGYAHPVPMWFVLEDDGRIRFTTFAKSQKIVNARRNPKVTILAEQGEEYSELRGVLIKAQAEVVIDVELAIDTMLRVAGQDPMMTGAEAEAAREGVRKVAEKRAVILCTPEKIISFDHRKLAGAF